MKSQFQFSDPELTKIEFGVNSNFQETEDQEVQMKMDLSVDVEIVGETGNEAKVSLTVCLGEEGDDFPFCLTARESAFFRWAVGQYEKDVLDKLLYQNAPSLLLSYLRPIIVQITTASPFNTYNLPFINFTHHNSKRHD